MDAGNLVAELVAPYERGLPDGVTIEVTAAPDLPAVEVDRALVSRSLTNLIENALHAMPPAGRLPMDAAVRNGMVAIAVSDTGVGMDPEALERPLSPTSRPRCAVRGLGLPIAKRNIELSGGSIAITSQRDQGTTVEVRLPLAV